MLTPQESSALQLSLLVGSVAVIVSMPWAIALGYGLARWQGRGRWLIEVLVNLPLVLPPVVTGYLLLLLCGRRGWIGEPFERYFGLRFVFTWYGAVIAAAVLGFPLMVRAIRLAFEGVDTRLEAAARTLGAGRWTTFRTISLPLAFRGVIAGGVLAFARALGEFGATIMLAGNIPGHTQTIPLAVYSLSQQPGGMTASYRLVCLSIVLACGALLVSEVLERRGRSREST
jgi:molybdate transport system permease protein